MAYKIKEVREALNISQEKLSELSGVSRAIISKLENNDNVTTTTSTLIAISNALGKNVNEIFFTEKV